MRETKTVARFLCSRVYNKSADPYLALYQYIRRVLGRFFRAVRYCGVSTLWETAIPVTLSAFYWHSIASSHEIQSRVCKKSLHESITFNTSTNKIEFFNFIVLQNLVKSFFYFLIRKCFTFQWNFQIILITWVPFKTLRAFNSSSYFYKDYFLFNRTNYFDSTKAQTPKTIC